MKPLNSDSDILQLAKDVSGFNVVEVYVDQGVIDTSSKKLNDVEDDDIVVIDGVEARVEVVAEGEVKAVVEGEIMAEGQVDQQTLVEVQVEVEVQVGEQGLVKVQVEPVGETNVQAQMEAEVHVHE